MRLTPFLAAAALVACTQPGSGAGDDANESAAIQSPRTAPDAGETTEPAVPPSGVPAPTEPQRPDTAGISDDADECDASEYQRLVGQPRSSIPEKPAGASWRITCTSCPITMDYSPARMNIFYDEKSEIVEEVRCG